MGILNPQQFQELTNDPQAYFGNHPQSQEAQDRDSVISSAWDSLKNFWHNNQMSPGYWMDQLGSWFNNSLGSWLGFSDSSNSADALKNVKHTDSGLAYDSSSVDSYVNAYNQEIANKRDDTAYSRLIADLKANGINPALFLSGGANAISSDNGFRSNYNLNTKDQLNSALKIGMILALLMRYSRMR